MTTMRIRTEGHFEAAHFLPFVPKAHKCSGMHGHNYRVEIEVDGDLDPLLGWVCDFAVLDAYLASFMALLDHKVINEKIENPTAENIAMWFLGCFAATNRPVSVVRIWETNKYWAEATSDSLPRNPDHPTTATTAHGRTILLRELREPAEPADVSTDRTGRDAG